MYYAINYNGNTKTGLIPVTTFSKVTYTPKGVRVVKCPADKEKDITCSNCALCAIPDRDYIIGFEAHGTAKKYVEKISLKQVA